VTRSHRSSINRWQAAAPPALLPRRMCTGSASPQVLVRPPARVAWKEQTDGVHSSSNSSRLGRSRASTTTLLASPRSGVRLPSRPEEEAYRLVEDRPRPSEDPHNRPGGRTPRAAVQEPVGFRDTEFTRPAPGRQLVSKVGKKERVLSVKPSQYPSRTRPAVGDSIRARPIIGRGWGIPFECNQHDRLRVLLRPTACDPSSRR
jgi:hypothetical protein